MAIQPQYCPPTENPFFRFDRSAAHRAHADLANGITPLQVGKPFVGQATDLPVLRRDRAGVAIRAFVEQQHGSIPQSVGNPFVQSSLDLPRSHRDPRRWAVDAWTPPPRTPYLPGPAPPLIWIDNPVLARDRFGVAVRAQDGFNAGYIIVPPSKKRPALPDRSQPFTGTQNYRPGTPIYGM